MPSASARRRPTWPASRAQSGAAPAAAAKKTRSVGPAWGAASSTSETKNRNSVEVTATGSAFRKPKPSTGATSGVASARRKPPDPAGAAEARQRPSIRAAAAPATTRKAAA